MGAPTQRGGFLTVKNRGMSLWIRTTVQLWTIIGMNRVPVECAYFFILLEMGK